MTRAPPFGIRPRVRIRAGTAKKKNVTQKIAETHPDAGDAWTWTAIDADSKLVILWLVGSRDAGSAYTFMQDVAARLRNRVQLTTDGHRPYLEAVEAAFGADIDYAMLQKIYGTDPGSETRYSPAVCLGCKVEEISGKPNPKHISTSYVERQNLTMRMHMRRFTRLTNALTVSVGPVRSRSGRRQIGAPRQRSQ